MKVLWNDQVVERDTVKIDIEDRGYQFGDGLYEALQVYNGKMYMVKEHFERLQRCAKKIRMALPYSVEAIIANLNKLIAAEQIQNGVMYLQVTRGVEPRDHNLPEPGTIPGVLTANVTPIERLTQMQQNGLKTVVVPDQRWLHCDIKSLSLLGNLLSLDEARTQGYDDALLQRDGYFTEASASNLWFVVGDTIYTHEDGNLVLPGITKIKTLALARELGLTVKEEAFPVSRLEEATECFETNSVWEVVPVVAINGRQLTAGAGPITAQLQQAYIAAVNDFIEA